MSKEFKPNEEIIFLSSVYREFSDLRESIVSCFDNLEVQVEAMERFGPDAKPPIEMCLEKLSHCTIYLGILGRTYGSVDYSGKFKQN